MLPNHIQVSYLYNSSKAPYSPYLHTLLSANYLIRYVGLLENSKVGHIVNPHMQPRLWGYRLFTQGNQMWAQDDDLPGGDWRKFATGGSWVVFCLRY